MAITYQPRTGLPQWPAGADPFTRAQVDDAFAKLESFMARGEQGPLSQLPAPAVPTTATANVGGTLAPATYGYRITALSPAAGSFPAGETTPSPEVTRIVPAGTNTNTVTLNWTAVPGATGYRIYGRTAGAELLLATVGAVVTWTDTGANAPAGAMPAVNTTAGRPAPGIRNRTYWATDDRTGRYSYDDGTNWYDLGPSPVTGPQAGSTALIVGHASAATSDAVLVMRGKTGQTGDLLKVQDPTATTDYVRVGPGGSLYANASATFRPSATSSIGFLVNGLSGQTGDLQQWQANGTLVGKIAADGGQTIARATGGISQTITTEAATFHDGSLVISRTATSGHQSIAFTLGTAYSMALGRPAFSDDLVIRSWDGGTERQLYRFAANQATLTLDSQIAAVSNYVRFERQGTLRGLVGITKGAGDLMPSDADGDLILRYADGGAANLRWGSGTRSNGIVGTQGAMQITPSSTAGTALIINPDPGYVNALTSWQVGGAEKARVNYTGEAYFTGNLYAGPGALGAATGRHRLTADGTWAYFVAEDQSGTINKGQMFQAGSSGWLWQVNGATSLATLTSSGFAVAPAGYAGTKIGPGAISGTGGYVTLGSNGTGGVVSAHSAAGTTLDLIAPIQPDGHVRMCVNGGTPAVEVTGAPGALKLGFMAATPIAKPTVTGSKGANAALTSLMSALSTYGLVTDSTT